MARADVQDRRLLFGRWGDYKYRAFFSYSHADAEWADKIEKRLKDFILPRELESVWTEFGPPPRRMKPYFRDRRSQGVYHSLDEAIENALDESAALIVICSPRSAQSPLVAEEIIHFIKSGRRERVFPIIIDGEPHAASPDKECFPAPLKYALDDQGKPDLSHPLQPIAADARPGKDGWPYAFHKLAAGMLGVDADLISRRDLKREQWETRRRRAGFVIAALGIVSVALAGVAYRSLRATWAAQNELLAARSIEALSAGDRNEALLFALEGVNANSTFLIGRPNSASAMSALGLALADTGAPNAIVGRNPDFAVFSDNGLALLGHNNSDANASTVTLLDGDGRMYSESSEVGALFEDKSVTTLALANDGSRAAIGYSNGDLRSLDIRGSDVTTHDLNASTSAIVMIAIANKQLVSDRIDERERIRRQLPEQIPSLSAVVDADNILKIFRDGDGNPLHQVELPGEITRLEFSPSADLLLITYKDTESSDRGWAAIYERVVLIDMSSPENIYSGEVDIRQIGFGRNDSELFFLDSTGRLYISRLQFGEFTQEDILSRGQPFSLIASHAEGATFQKFSIDRASGRLVTVSDDGEIRVWEACGGWCLRHVVPNNVNATASTVQTISRGDTGYALAIHEESGAIMLPLEPPPDRKSRIRMACQTLGDQRVLKASKRRSLGLAEASAGPCDRKSILSSAPYRTEITNIESANQSANSVTDSWLSFKRLTDFGEIKKSGDIAPDSDRENPGGPQCCLRISDAGLNLIMRFEGLELEAYQDIAGIWTIGFGHVSSMGPPDVTPGMRITAEEATQILRNDLRPYEDRVLEYVTVPLNQNEFDALVSFVYNTGSEAFRRSTALRRLNRGDRIGAEEALTWWNRATVGGVLREIVGLTRRRAAERALFLTPVNDEADETSEDNELTPDAEQTSP